MTLDGRDPASDLARPAGAGGGTAEDVFVEWLEARESGTAGSIDELCEEHPDCGEALRVLHGDWLRVAPALERARVDQTVVENLERRFGSKVDPGISLDVRASVSGERVASELLERLAADHAGGARYELRGEVARGGMGAVMQAWDRDLRRNLAMKVVLGRQGLGAAGASPDLSPRDLSRFLEEAQVTAQLEHPNIVPVHELGVDDVGRAYFTMPLVRGRELKTIIAEVHAQADGAERPAEDRWTLRRALGVVLRVCEAVAYAHSKGVLHRDIKPSNVMVGRFGEVYLMDWGLARVKGREGLYDSDRPEGAELETVRGDLADRDPNSTLLTRDGDVVGTPAYMSPEQGRGEAEALDARADVYSLGALLYHLVSGRAPYQDDVAERRAESVLLDLLDGPPEPLAVLAPETPPDLVAIVERAMQRKAADRYGTASELARDLERFLESVPVQARQASLAHRLRLGYRRHRTLVNMAAGFALVFGASWIAFRVQWAALVDRLSAPGEALFVKRAAIDLARLPSLDVTQTDRVRTWLEDSKRVLDSRENTVEGALKFFRQDGDDGGPMLAELVEELEEIERSRPHVATHLDALEGIAARDDSAAWTAALDRLRAHPEFAGFELAPQQGLVPLGPDPESRLEEFWLPASGSDPVRDAEHGRLRLGDDFGLVFVLVPGGSYTYGLLNPKQAERMLEREVEPFLISKYELTIGQARRALPSYGKSGDLRVAATVLDWNQCDRIARAYGCRLPSSVEWEYAARCGSDSLYGTGTPKYGDVKARENIRDRDYFEYFSRELNFSGEVAEWSDGNVQASRVGAYDPTPWGLHDVYGNVSEWCITDGVAPDGVFQVKLLRGGAWGTLPSETTLLDESWQVRAYTSEGLGTRLAFSLDG